jgi:membrane-associated phospholipid phosphatase
MKRFLALLFCITILPFSIFSEEKTLVFNPLWDSLALAGGFGSSAFTMLALGSKQGAFVEPDISELWGLDCGVIFPFNDGLDKASVVLEGGVLLWPACFGFLGEEKEWLPAAAIYAEALSYAYAAKGFLKYAFPKARPYAYASDNLTQSQREEAYESFPSGHTTLAFCAATSFSVLAEELAPEKAATPWLIAGAYSAAAAEAILRVVSGNHFPSDVIAGALLGSGIGFLVTELHIAAGSSEKSADSEKLSLSGPGLVLKISY